MSLLKGIKEEHEQFVDIAEEFLEGEVVGDPKEEFENLKSDLIAHFNAEERVLFERFELVESEKGLALLEKIRAQHQLVVHQLDMLDGLDPGSRSWVAHMDLLVDVLEYHFETEEDDLFKRAKKRFGKEELDLLEAPYLEMLNSPDSLEDDLSVIEDDLVLSADEDIDPDDLVLRAKYVDDDETAIDETRMADPEITLDREDDIERFVDR